MENDVFSAIKAAEQLLLDSLDMDVDLVMKLKEFAREIFLRGRAGPAPGAGAQYAASPDTPAAPGACGPALLLTLSEMRAGRKMEIILCLLLLLEQLLAACVDGGD